jgi:ribosomal protein L9
MIQGFGHASTFFDERNVFAQCYRCNVDGYGMNRLFKQRFIERFGEEAYNEVKEKSRETKQWTKQELKLLAVAFREKLNELSTVVL